MAPSGKSLSFLFLLLLISSFQIHARESQFFSKVTRDSNSSSNNNNNINAAAKETQLPEREEAVPSRIQDEEPSFTPQNHNGFGLYGHGSEQFSPNSVNDAYYTPTNFPKKPNPQQKSFSTGYPTNNYNYNGYETKQQGGASETRYMDTAYLNNNNNYNYRYGSNQKAMSDDSRYVDTAYLNNNKYYNGNDNKQQGMSDTRFMENGKYFYGNNNQNGFYHNQYETEKESHNGYGSYRGLESRKKYNYGGYNGNNKNSYEFTNSMDGFQNQDEEFQESQEYIP